MRNFKIYGSFLMVCIITLLYIRCTDDPLFQTRAPDSSANIQDETLKAMKQCFEKDATTLKQVNYNLSPDISTRSTEDAAPCCCTQSRSRSTSEKPINIVPKWECASLWEGEQMIYAEIPLSGKGIHEVAFLQTGDKRETYLVSNLLMMTQNKENQEIHYYIVTALINPKKFVHARRDKLFKFVGNEDFDGIVLYSKPDGTCYKALHVHDKKSHPIYFSHAPTTRGIAEETTPTGSSIMLTSQPASYNNSEIEDGAITAPECKCTFCNNQNCIRNYVRCAICRKYYNPNTGDCPNNCDVVITPGTGGGGGSSTGTKTCPYCNLQYSSAWSKCPNGCEDVCSKCKKRPCECTSNLHVCERCGSSSCPGPWVCGGSGGGGNGSGNNNGEGNKECNGVQCDRCGGYKNSTNANCPKCTCFNFHTIDIAVLPPIINLGEQYKILIFNTSTNKDVEITETAYLIAQEGSEDFIPIEENSPMSATYKAYSPGKWKVKAISTFSNGAGAISREFSFTVQNPLYSTIMQHPTVVAKMESLWAAAVQDAQKNPPVYHEKGCVILFNTTDNSYEFEDVADSNEFNCNGITEIHFSFDTHTKYPIRGGRHPVATFHTHPARTKCDKEVGHEVGPSKIDKEMKTVCLLYDYIGTNGYILGGHSPKAPYKIYHCAEERHPLNN